MPSPRQQQFLVVTGNGMADTRKDLLTKQLNQLGSVHGVPLRDPYQSELDYFKKNPNVAGMAADDDSIIINPYSSLSDQEKNAVKVNEAARVHMRSKNTQQPDFELTPEQAKAFSTYGPLESQRQTIVGRILSNDPSALNVSPEQKAYADIIRSKMNMK